MLCSGALSWWSLKDPIVCNFHSNSHRPLSQTVQDFKIIFLVHCDTRRYKLFINYPRKSKKKLWQFSWLFICSCELSSVLQTVACGIPHTVSWFQGRIRKTNFDHLLWPDQENLVQFRAVQAFLPTLRFDPHFERLSFFYGTIFAHTFLMFTSCVPLWWTVHSLIWSRVRGAVTNNNGFWIGWFDLLTTSFRISFNHNQL
jgi:hypothetical protein